MNAAGDFMAQMAARLEHDSLVRKWCEANGGCVEVPCICHSRFEPPVPGEEQKLVAKRPARPALTLVWSQP